MCPDNHRVEESMKSICILLWVWALTAPAAGQQLATTDTTALLRWQQIRRPGFKLAITTRDSTLAPALLGTISAGVSKIQQFFNDTYRRPFVVRVFPDRASLTAYWRLAWNLPDFKPGCWMVASGTAETLALLSPARWRAEACEHDPADSSRTRLLIIHELVHVFHGQMNPRPDFDGLEAIGWFAEGLATYVSGQLFAGYLANPREAIEKGSAPKQLEKAWSGTYCYGVSGSLVHFIDNCFGRKRISKALAATSEDSLLHIFGVTEAGLLRDWQEFVLHHPAYEY